MAEDVQKWMSKIGKVKDTTSVCIGDIVCLYCEDMKGFMFSSQSSNAHNGVAIAKNQDAKNPKVGTQHMILFQIYTQNRYKANKKYEKLKIQAAHEPQNFHLQSEVHHAEKANMYEEADNEKEQSRLFGKNLRYGEIIQLKHLFTNKFLHVNKAETAQVEPNCLKVELLSRNGKTAQFKMSPRYKVKTEGETIRYEDLLSLESIKSVGHFLHASTLQFDAASSYKGNHELCLSKEPTGFKVFRCRTGVKKSDDPAKQDPRLKGGAIVQLYHKEKEGFVAAEGQFGDKIVENVHLRVWDSSLPRKNPGNPRTSISCWIIVKEKSCYDGTFIRWDEPLRLRHVTTRQFMVINSDGTVGLIDNRDSPATLFKFYAVDKKSDDGIPTGAYVRIQHVETGFWLAGVHDLYRRSGQAEKATPAPEEGGSTAPVDPDEESLQNLVWSNAVLKQMRGSEIMTYDDAFSVTEVKSDFRQAINYASGQVPFFQKLLVDFTNKVDFTPKQQIPILSALDEMQRKMRLDGLPVKMIQTLFRNFRMVDTIINLLKVPPAEAKKDDKESFMTTVFAKCYSILQDYLAGESKKNEMYVAQHFEFLQAQLFVEGQVGLNATQVLMQLIKDNQMLINLVSDKEIDAFVSLIQKNKSYRYLQLLEALCVVNGVPIVEKQNYVVKKWLEEPLKRNEDVIDFIELGQDVGLKEGIVYLSIDNKRSRMPVPDFCKVNGPESEPYKFLEGQLRLFGILCKGRNRQAVDWITEKLRLFTIEIAFICLQDKNVAPGIRARFCSNITDIYVDVPGNSSNDRDTLVFNYQDFVEKEGDNKSKSQRSVVPVQYMKEMKAWISNYLEERGMMIASDIQQNNLSEQVLILIYTLADFGYYSKAEDMVKMLKPLLNLIDGQTDLPFPPDEKDKILTDAEKKETEQAIREYREESRFVQSEQNRAVVDAKFQACKVIELVFRTRFAIRQEKYVQVFRYTLEHQYSAELALFLKTNENFRNPKNNKLAVKMADSIFNETKYFSDEFLAINLDLQKYKYHHLVTQALFLLDRYFSEYESLYKKFLQTKLVYSQDALFALRKVSDEVPTLKALKVSKLSKKNMQLYTEIIHDFTRLCCLEEDSREPHALNQDIIYNHEILGDIFDMMVRISKSKVLHDPEKEELFKPSYRFLKVLAKKNETIQGRLLARFDLFLGIKQAPNDLGEMLIEIFKRNTANCLKVRTHHVEEIVERYAKTSHPIWIALLNSMIFVDGFPIKRNQAMVMRELMHFKETLEILNKTDKEEKVRYLTATEEISFDFERKRKLCNLLQLLSMCSMGENKTVESICQCLITFDDLLDLINTPNLCDGFRCPLILFMVWVFLNSSSTTSQKEIAKFGKDTRIDRFVGHLIETFRKGTAILQVDTRAGVELLRDRPTNIHRANEDLEHEQKETLYYIMDALLPFLYVLLKRHFNRTIFPATEHMDVLGRVLVEFADVGCLCISKVYQRLELLNTIRLLSYLSGTPLKPPLELQQDITVKTDSLVKYEIYHKEEIDLNKKFTLFTKNLQTAYEGENTCRVQIGINNDKQYIPLDTEEKLPLGQEFQAMVRCFLKKGTKLTDAPRCYDVGGILLHLKHSINVVGMSETNRFRLGKLDHKLLKCLRTCVHNEVCRLPANKLDNEKLYETITKNITTTQEYLNDQGVVEACLPHLGRENTDIVKEVLYFFNILYKGTDKTPQAFVKFIKNEHHESYFLMVKENLNVASSLIKEQRSLIDRYRYIITETQALYKKQQIADALSTMGSDAKKNGDDEEDSGMIDPRAALRQLEREKGELLEMRLAKLEHKAEAPKATKKKKPPKAGAKPEPVAAPAEPKNDEPITVYMDRPFLSVYKDTNYINVLLQMIQSLCDMQYIDAQNLCREQPNTRSVNLVALATNFAQDLVTRITRQYIGMVLSNFNTIGELVRGNKLNQGVAFDSKVIDSINTVLITTDYHGSEHEQIADLWWSVGHVLMFMIEENHRINSGAPGASVVVNALERDALWTTAEECYKRYMSNDKEITKKAKERYLDAGFCYFSSLMRAVDLKMYDEDSKKANSTWGFYAFRTHSIEYVSRDDIMQRFHFRVRDHENLRPEVEEKLTWEVDRTNQGKKQRDYLQYARDIVVDIHYQRRVNANPFSSFFVHRWKFFNQLNFVMSFGMQIVLLVMWSRSDWVTGGPVLMPPDQADFNDTMQKVCGYPHNVVSLSMSISFFFSNVAGFATWVARMGEEARAAWEKFRQRGVGAAKTIPRQPSKFEVGILSASTIYYILFFVCSQLGTNLSLAFFAFHLLQLIANNQLLSKVILAITVNGRSLLWVTILGFLLIYIYGIIGFLIYRTYIQIPGYFCSSLIQCTVTTIREGLIQNFKRIDYPVIDKTTRNFGRYAYKLIYDISFFVIVLTIGLNVIFGMIVDAFKQLRDKQWKTESNMQSQCFICERAAFEFEQKSIKFSYHARKEHSMVGYVFLLVHIGDTADPDLSNAEMYIDELLKEENFKFWPMNRAISLDGVSDGAPKLTRESVILKTIEDIEKRVDELRRHNAIKPIEAEKKDEKKDEQPPEAIEAAKPSSATKINAAGPSTYVQPQPEAIRDADAQLADIMLRQLGQKDGGGDATLPIAVPPAPTVAVPPVPTAAVPPAPTAAVADQSAPSSLTQSLPAKGGSALRLSQIVPTLPMPSNETPKQ